MRLYILLLVLGVAAVAAGSTNPQRIVGGSTTSIGVYPFGVSLIYSATGSNHRQQCGGSILNNRAVLTAAHCTIADAGAVQRWRVRAGSSSANSGGTVFNSARIINHAQYNRNTYDNDISIIRISSTFSFTIFIQRGFFASSTYNLADNQQVWAIGWGATSQGGSLSETLRHVQIWTINQTTCRNRYNAIGRTVTNNMLCSGVLDVGGRDQCQNDSGGPLIHNNVIVGVCSWGQGCAQARFPGVNTRVSRYMQWIQNNS